MLERRGYTNYTTALSSCPRDALLLFSISQNPSGEGIQHHPQDSFLFFFENTFASSSEQPAYSMVFETVPRPLKLAMAYGRVTAWLAGRARYP